MKLVPLQVESPHTDFAEVTRMVLVEVNSRDGENERNWIEKALDGNLTV